MSVGILAAALLIAAITLLFNGLRGRQLGDHPHCRRCRYDLHGQPDASTVCPECGSDLAAPRAITTGLRQRSVGLLTSSVLLMLLALAFGAVVIITTTRHIDWITYQPTWWVLRNASSKPYDARALNELNRRNIAGLLSNAQLKNAFDAGVRLQADPTFVWDTRWTTIMNRARAAGAVDDQSWLNHLQASLQPVLQMRSRINAGDPLFVIFTSTGEYRGGPLQLQMSYEVHNLRIGNAPIITPVAALNTSILGRSAMDPLPLVNAGWFKPGQYTITADITATWLEVDRRTLVATPVLTKTIPWQRSLLVASPDQPIAMTVVDPALRAKVASTLAVRATQLGPQLHISVNVKGGQVKTAQHVEVTIGDRVLKGTNTFISTPPNWQAWGDQFDIDTTGVTAITVTLKADRDLIARHTEDTPIWGEDVVFPNVKIDRPAPQ